MKKNLGVTDKGLRYFLATLTAYYGFTLEPRSGVNGLLILAGFYLFITATLGICWIYQAFGWDTRDRVQREREDREAETPAEEPHDRTPKI